jgi:hypothetical protein
MCVCTQVSCSVVSNWPLCEFCGRVYCDILYIFLIPQFLRHQTMDKVQKHNSFNTNTPSSESYRNHTVSIQKSLPLLPVQNMELMFWPAQLQRAHKDKSNNCRKANNQNTILHKSSKYIIIVMPYLTSAFHPTFCMEISCFLDSQFIKTLLHAHNTVDKVHSPLLIECFDARNMSFTGQL